MWATRRRLIAAGAIVAMLVGVFLEGVGTAAELQAWGQGDLTSSAFGHLPPVTAPPAAVRTRPLLDGSLLSVVRSSKSRLDGLKVALLAGLVLAATTSWSLSRPDRSAATPLRRRASGASRAPPSLRLT